MASDITVRLHCSTWRLDLTLWVFRIALAVLPVRWVAPVVAAFIAWVRQGDRLMRFFVSVRPERTA